MSHEIPNPETPLATGHGPRTRHVETDRRQLADEHRVVLVVEDDPANRELLVELLAGWGYEPVSVGTAEEAEFAVRRKSVDAALVDVFLPGRSGTELLTKLRAKFPEAVLIGMSALSDSAVARRCKAIGADLFLGKPFDSEALAGALEAGRQSWH